MPSRRSSADAQQLTPAYLPLSLELKRVFPVRIPVQRQLQRLRSRNLPEHKAANRVKAVCTVEAVSWTK